MYDLEERVERFGESVIELTKKIQLTAITKPLIEQLVRSSTSVGANYFEANGASSKKDFINKIHIVKKEIKESQHWLRMISKAHPLIINEAKLLWKEAQELVKIFSKILVSSKKKRT